MTQTEKYKALYTRIAHSEGFFKIPNRERPKCTRFVMLWDEFKNGDGPESYEALEEASVLAEAEFDSPTFPRCPATSSVEQETPTRVSTCAVREFIPVPTEMIEKYAVHPALALIPEMSEEQNEELGQDIKANGQQLPIVVHQGRIVDGRARAKACAKVNVTPKYVEWSGEDSLVAWILAMNLHRRHLNDSQRAMVAAGIAEALAAERKENHARGCRRGTTADAGLDPGPIGERRVAMKAAKDLDVSRDATNKAIKIRRFGDDALANAVTQGTVSIDAAATVAVLPHEKQRALLATGGVVEEAKRIRQDKQATKAGAAKNDAVLVVTDTHEVPRLHGEEMASATVDHLHLVAPLKSARTSSPGTIAEGAGGQGKIVADKRKVSALVDQLVSVLFDLNLCSAAWLGIHHGQQDFIVGEVSRLEFALAEMKQRLVEVAAEHHIRLPFDVCRERSPSSEVMAKPA